MSFISGFYTFTMEQLIRRYNTLENVIKNEKDPIRAMELINQQAQVKEKIEALKNKL